MSSKLQQRVRKVFNVCLRTHSTEQRAKVIERECDGDLELKSAVIRLLHAHDVDASYLERPLDNLLADQLTRQFAATVATSKIATEKLIHVGPYKIREKLGEGGMGVVYVAEQSKPIRRKVALKIIKPGVGSDEVVARFEAERQALAMMDHPNIARVFDGGTAETGQPFFVMELVQGLPINEYCDQHKLNPRQRLQLLEKVCRAVQHAHQKGIIHRDLKPSNVLVAEIDGQAVPKVIDFGIAKATNQKLTDETIYTQLSQTLGTPMYMSPEQAGLGVVDIDTRSDVYSLGVLAYELLTGSTPFPPSTLKDKGIDEFRRVLREVEPRRPSVVVSTLRAEALSTVAGRSASDRRKLANNLRGELDWLVMKALEKDRARRYESAGDFAADIQHYLNDEPVKACPPSWAYRGRKLVRRHKFAITTVAAVAAALLLGTGVSVWQAVEANQARQIAEENQETAIDAVDEMYIRLATTWLASDTEATDTQRHFLERAEQFYRRIAEKPGRYRLSSHRLAEIHNRIGAIKYAMKDFEAAVTAFEAAIAIEKKLLQTEPNNLVILARLASNLSWAGRSHTELGHENRAESSYEGSRDYFQSLAKRKPQVVEHRVGIVHALNSLAELRLNQDRLADAERLIRDSQQIREASVQTGDLSSVPNYIKTRALLARILIRQRKYDEALKLAKASLVLSGIRQMRAGDNRGDREFQAQLHGEVAAALIAQGKYKTAEPHLRHQLQILVDLMAAQRDPFAFSADAFFRRDPTLGGKEEPRRWYQWVEISLQLARVLRKTGQHAKAEIVLGRAITVSGLMAGFNKNVLKYRVIESNVLAEAALLLADRWPEESRSCLINAVDAWRSVIADFDNAARYKSGLHGIKTDLAWFGDKFPEFDFADPAKRQAINAILQPPLSQVLVQRVRALYFRGYDNWSDAVRQFRDVVKTRDGSDAFDRFHLAIALAKTDKPEEALHWFKSGAEWMEQNKGGDDADLVRLQEEAEKVTRQ